MTTHVSQILDELVLIIVKYLFTLCVEAVCGKLILHPTAVGHQGLGCIDHCEQFFVDTNRKFHFQGFALGPSVRRSESWKGCYCSLQIGHRPMEHHKHRLN